MRVQNLWKSFLLSFFILFDFTLFFVHFFNKLVGGNFHLLLEIFFTWCLWFSKAWILGCGWGWRFLNCNFFTWHSVIRMLSWWFFSRNWWFNITLNNLEFTNCSWLTLFNCHFWFCIYSFCTSFHLFSNARIITSFFDTWCLFCLLLFLSLFFWL